MRLLFLVFAFIIVFCSGCGPILKAVYHVDRKFSFASRSDYLNFLNSSYSLTPGQMLYVDSLSLFPLINEMSKSEMTEYYGALINDSLEIRKSGFLKENMSCIGRVLKEIEANSDKIEDSLLVKNEYFRSYKFYTISNDEQFRMQNDAKLKIFLVYSYRYGTYFDSLYRDVATMAKDKSDRLALYVISLDPIQSLPK